MEFFYSFIVAFGFLIRENIRVLNLKPEFVHGISEDLRVFGQFLCGSGTT